MTDKYIYMLIYFAVMAVAGLVLARNKTVQDYLIAGRANPGFIMAAGMAIGSIDALWFVFFSGMAFSIGWGFLYVAAGILTGLAGLHFKADVIKTVSTRHNMHTLSDWFFVHFGPKTGKLVGIIIAVNFLAWATATTASAGMVLSSIFAVQYTTAIIGIAVVALPLLLKGGYASLTRFDVLQFCMVAIGLGIIYAIGLDAKATLTLPSIDTFQSLGLWGACSLFISMFCTCFAAGDFWQRIYAANGEREAAKGFRWTYLLFALGLLAPATFGYMVKTSGYTGVEDDVFSYFVSALLTPFGQAVFLIVLLAAITSTLNVAVFGAAMTLAKDFATDKDDENALRRRVKMIVAAIIIVVCILALNVPSIMTLGLAVLSISTCICGLLAISLYTSWQVSDVTAFIAIGCATIIYVVLVVTDMMKPEYSGLPLVANFAIVGLAQVLGKTKASVQP